jgi:large subunit ribosomal protein L15
MRLNQIADNEGARKGRMRVGRGIGSGKGKTSGKGVKGQKARTGHHGARLGFEGGQMPMQRRFPKKGFKNPFRKEIFAVNVGALEKRFPAGTVDLAALQGAGMVPRSHKSVKILGEGDITKKFVVKASAFSTSAKEKIEKAGGTVEVVSA